LQPAEPLTLPSLEKSIVMLVSRSTLTTACLRCCTR